MINFKHVGLDVETNLEAMFRGILEGCSENDLKNLIDRIDLEVADWEFTNQIYELFREKHADFLIDQNIDEKKYREEFCHDPSIYDDEEDNESWSTDDIKPEERIKEGALVLGDEEDVDVFSTETEH